jgi:amidophosphoribosyltransferase
MARDAGAKKVYFASCAPPIRYPNVYGIDMPTRHELVAHGRSDEEVAEEIGADRVIYQDLHDLVESVRRFNPAIETFDTSVFDKCYITGDVDEKYLAHLEGVRSDESTARLSIDSDCVGLYNSYQPK